MWVLLLATVMVVLSGQGARTLPASASKLDIVSDILSDLDDLPGEESDDDDVSPELLELYHDVDLLYEMQNSNLSESRDGRGLLSKLSFITGLKLGSYLSTSGTLAASQSFNFLGKILNTALSVSYGNIGGYQQGLYGGLGGLGGLGGIGTGIEPVVTSPVVTSPIVGLQKLPVIEENVPTEDKKREKLDATLSTVSTVSTKTKTPDAVRKEFLKMHNQRVEHFNNAFDAKIKTRTGRIVGLNTDKIT